MLPLDLSQDVVQDATVIDPAPAPNAPVVPKVRRHHRELPLRVGTRASPLALVQTRMFLHMLTTFCPVLRGMDVFQEHAITTTGDAVQDRKLAEIGGKGLFAKEIHEALSERRVDFAVHSLKDLETTLPPGIVLACTLPREDASDVLILADEVDSVDEADPFAVLKHGALIGTCSVRRQAQLMHARPDLRITTMRGNVHSRLDKVRHGTCDASLLALAGLKRLGLESEASVVIDPAIMVPAAGQGIVGVTMRAEDEELLSLLSAIEDKPSRAAAEAERAMLAYLDGSCSTPIGAHARIGDDGTLSLTGLVASEDGTFLLRRQLSGPVADAARIGLELGISLKADSPEAIFRA
jgi:hydroxymethylbilane synthase